MSAYSYATLEQIRQELGAADTDTSNNAVVNEYRIETTRRIDDRLKYLCVPTIKTYKVFVGSQDFDHQSGLLMLREPLLALTSVTNFDATALTVWDGTQSGLYTCEVLVLPEDGPPYHSLQRMSGGGVPANWLQTSERMLLVTGVWGWHNDYANAWIDSAITLAANISAGATSFTVTSAVGADSEGYSPRFSQGQLAKIGSEVFTITSVTDGDPNDTVAVVPGSLGSTQAAHSSGAAISVWKPDPNIVRACRRLAAFMARRRKRFDSFTIDTGGLSVTKFPADLPEEIETILKSMPRYTKRAAVRRI